MSPCLGHPGRSRWNMLVNLPLSYSVGTPVQVQSLACPPSYAVGCGTLSVLEKSRNVYKVACRGRHTKKTRKRETGCLPLRPPTHPRDPAPKVIAESGVNGRARLLRSPSKQHYREPKPGPTHLLRSSVLRSTSYRQLRYYSVADPTDRTGRSCSLIWGSLSDGNS